MMSPSGRKANRPLANRLLFVAIVVVATGGIFGVLVLSFGRVSGTEFSPDQFARRNFVYYRMPLIRVQITPVVRWNEPHGLEDRLTKNNAILTQKKAGVSRWDIVSMWAGAGKQSGDAEILCNYLDAEDENGELAWLEWTNEDVARATPFWKAVQRIADLQAYYLAPGLFELAARHPEAESLAEAIDAYMASECESLADDYSSLAQHELAARFYAEALKYDADSSILKQKHAEAERQVGGESTSRT